MANVLLLEPNSLLAQVYSHALMLNGHAVIAVYSAQAAVHAADTRHPDIIVMELQLPSHSGVEFLHELRSYPEWQRVPVVVNTGLHPTRLQTVRQVLEESLGVVAVLYKPAATLADICKTVGVYTDRMVKDK